MYEQDRLSVGMRIVEVRPGYARLAMKVREDMVNGHQICHGGLIFTLADSAFAFACNTYDLVTVAAAGTIEFLLAGRLGDELTATAEERTRSKRTGVYDVSVHTRGECVALRGRSHQIGGSITAAGEPGTHREGQHRRAGVPAAARLQWRGTRTRTCSLS
jgi:acyl-CoA thioesterase